jgi:hypothetical protein
MHKEIDEEGYDITVSGTTSDMMPFKKKDYAPSATFDELDIPEYNGQMEVKDFSL